MRKLMNIFTIRNFKHNDWWIFTQLTDWGEYTAWGSKTKITSLKGMAKYNNDVYFQFGDTRKEAIDKLIIELDEVGASPM